MLIFTLEGQPRIAESMTQAGIEVARQLSLAIECADEHPDANG